MKYAILLRTLSEVSQ